MKFDLCGLPVDSVTRDEVLDLVVERCSRPPPPAEQPLTVFSCNVDMIVKAHRNVTIREDLSRASLLIPDGMPVVWLGRALGGPFPERVTGADLLPAVARRAPAAGIRIVLLGAAPGVARRAAVRLEAMAPGLKIAGAISPPFGFDRDPARVEAVVSEVRALRPDVLFVALGAPRQERFVLAHASRLGARVLFPVGAAIDMAAGLVKRAPRFVQRAGGEWLWRLVQEPRRLGRRYLLEDPVFFRLAMSALVARRRQRALGAPAPELSLPAPGSGAEVASTLPPDWNGIP